MPPLPKILVNDSVDKGQIDEERGAEDGNDLDQSGNEEEEPWWRAFKLWKVNMRGLVDDDISDWWFAGTAVPLVAATLGPLANVLSIGALVTPWRYDLTNPDDPSTPLAEILGTTIHDPQWCYGINAASLVFGVIGNLFLLLNFTQRIRYVIALPISTTFWFIASGFLIGDLAAVHRYSPPTGPTEIYSEGFWYGIAAAVIYLVLTILLMVNLVGYIRGHYPQHFELTEDQQTLIVQTMLYFVWLSGGAGVYSRIEQWRFVDALYWSDVTILTIGFGDLYPQTNLGRGLLIPYSIVGIIMLGLVITSIFRSVEEIGQKNIIRLHYERERERIIGRTVTTSLELERREIELELARERAHHKHHHIWNHHHQQQPHQSSSQSHSWAPHLTLHRSATSNEDLEKGNSLFPPSRLISRSDTLSSNMTSRRSSISSIKDEPALTRQSSKLSIRSISKKKSHIMLLREEKERFETMRKIQKQSEVWKNWWRLSITLSVFTVFWIVGAVIFWEAEKNYTGQSFWITVYFCWVSLLTIGYGDFAPKTGAGRTFFVLWSFIAVPTMTILASHLTNTVVSAFNAWSHTIADHTILPKYNRWRQLQDRFAEWRASLPGSKTRQQNLGIGDRTFTMNRTQTMRNEMFAAGLETPDINAIARQHDSDIERRQPDAGALARQLALAIRRAAKDMSIETPRQYSYEEWVEFTRLIRFSAVSGPSEVFKEAEEGMIEWDWLAENSPMMAEHTEAEFVLERLCESLVRYLRRNPPHEAFAGILKDKGEDALRLKAGGWAGASGGEAEAQMKEERSSLSPEASIPRSVASKTQKSPSKLHPLEEEEH